MAPLKICNYQHSLIKLTNPIISVARMGGYGGITTEIYIFADNAIEPNVVLLSNPHHDHPHRMKYYQTNMEH
jgi:hypothetical protein